MPRRRGRPRGRPPTRWRPSRNVAGDPTPIVVGADDADTWTENGRRVVVVRGQVFIQQGVVQLRAKEAVAFMELQAGVMHMDVYAEGDVQARQQHHHADRAASPAVAEHARRIQAAVLEEQGPPGLAGRRPAGAAGADGARRPGPAHRSLSGRGPRLLRGVKLPSEPDGALDPPPPTVQPRRLRGPDQPGRRPPRRRPGRAPGAVGRRSCCQAAGQARRGRTPLPPPAQPAGHPPAPPPGPRQFTVAPRGEQGFDIKGEPLPDGTQAVIVTGGVIVSVANVPGVGRLDLEVGADPCLVIWSKGGDTCSSLRSATSRTAQGQSTNCATGQFYLAGNVEQSRQSQDGEMRILRADEVYYDVNHNVAVALSALLQLKKPGVPTDIYVKSDELLELG